MTDPTQPPAPEPEPRQSSAPSAALPTGGAPPSYEQPQTDADHDTAAIAAIRTDPALRAKTLTPEAQPTPEDEERLRVQWVRPTDLAARAGARMLEKGIDVNQHTAALARQSTLEAARNARGKIRQALAHREQALTPDTPTTAPAPVLGRQGVSR